MKLYRNSKHQMQVKLAWLWRVPQQDGLTPQRFLAIPTLRARQKGCPDVFKRLNRNIHYAFRRFHSQFSLFATRKIHVINES
jgi:hypothetical protein